MLFDVLSNVGRIFVFKFILFSLTGTQGMYTNDIKKDMFSPHAYGFLFKVCLLQCRYKVI